MKKVICTLILCLAVVYNYAQQAPIMVCNAVGTTCTPYKNFDSAVINASAGNYIYIPGGSFILSTAINKELHFIGTGHYPDSTNITGISTISSQITLDTGCSNSSFEGLYISSISTQSQSYQNIYNLRISRCNISYLSLFNTIPYCCTYALQCNSCIINESIINSLNPYCNNCTVSNSIIRTSIQSLTSSFINNCIIYGSFFYNQYGASAYNNSNNTVKNNIFDSVDVTGSYQCSGCILINNLTNNNSLALGGATIETGTITNVPITNLFVNASAIGFDYTKNFHLKTTSSGHNAGDDGTDVGIYGGNVPYSPGAVPSNPHIYYQNVSGTTDASGNLPVHIKVRASY